MSFEQYSTSDGWTYGRGKYEKTIASYLGIKAPSYNAIVTVPSTIAGIVTAGATTAVRLAGTAVASVAYGKISSVTIPTYYIFATSPSGVKTVAEWPLAETTRDTIYSAWIPNFIATPAASKQAQINSILQEPIRSFDNLMSTMKNEVDLYFDVKKREIRHEVEMSASSAAASAVLPLIVGGVVVGAILFWLLRK